MSLLLKPNGHFEVAAMFKIMTNDDTQRKANWNKKKAFRPTLSTRENIKHAH